MKKIYFLSFLAILFASTHVYSQCNSASLVVDLRFDSTFVDSSQYNQSTFVLSSPTFGQDRHGNANSALNTTAGSVFLNNSTTGEFKAPFPFTFSGWVYPNVLNARNPVFMNEDHGSAYSGAWINVTQDGAVTANIGDGGAAGAQSRVTAITGNSIISTGQWYNISVVFASINDMRVYVDGVLQSVTYDGTGDSLYYYKISGTAGKIGSGVNGTGSNALFNGLLDDFRFWNDSLPEPQIQTIYNSHTNFISVESVTICDDQTTEITAQNIFCDYNWSNGDNDPTNDINGSQLAIGNNTIYAEMYDEFNVKYTDSVNVIVTVCTDIDEKATQEILLVYPNPTKGATIINFPGADESASISIYDVTGKQVFRQDGIMGSQYILNENILNAGLYSIVITGKESYTAKLVVQ